MTDSTFRTQFFDLMTFPDNPYHPLVWINGNPKIGEGTYIGGFTDINANGARLTIGNHCDIASFVAVNVADTHLQAIGLADAPQCRDIDIADHVFIGSHSVIMGGTRIGERSVIGAGTIVNGLDIPPYSLAVGNPAVVKPGYYRDALVEKGLIVDNV
ncbi:MAG: acyltransferase [Rhodospirillales bacterium]|nr:acyltransferase [Rhodospirillales bacterium]